MKNGLGALEFEEAAGKARCGAAAMAEWEDQYRYHGWPSIRIITSRIMTSRISHIYIYTYTYIQIHINLYLIYIYIYICIHTYIYIYTHIYEAFYWGMQDSVFFPPETHCFGSTSNETIPDQKDPESLHRITSRGIPIAMSFCSGDQTQQEENSVQNPRSSNKQRQQDDKHSTNYVGPTND